MCVQLSLPCWALLSEEGTEGSAPQGRAISPHRSSQARPVCSLTGGLGTLSDSLYLWEGLLTFGCEQLSGCGTGCRTECGRRWGGKRPPLQFPQRSAEPRDWNLGGHANLASASGGPWHVGSSPPQSLPARHVHAGPSPLCSQAESRAAAPWESLSHPACVGL